MKDLRFLAFLRNLFFNCLSEEFFLYMNYRFHTLPILYLTPLICRDSVVDTPSDYQCTGPGIRIPHLTTNVQVLGSGYPRIMKTCLSSPLCCCNRTVLRFYFQQPGTVKIGNSAKVLVETRKNASKIYAKCHEKLHVYIIEDCLVWILTITFRTNYDNYSLIKSL
jgi:hypothetical protein